MDGKSEIFNPFRLKMSSPILLQKDGWLVWGHRGWTLSQLLLGEGWVNPGQAIERPHNQKLASQTDL